MIAMVYKAGGENKIIRIPDSGDFYENVAHVLGWRPFPKTDKRYVDPLWYLSQHSITKVEKL